MTLEVILGLAVGIAFVVTLAYALGAQEQPLDTSSLTRDQARAVRIALADNDVRELLKNRQAEVGFVQTGGVSSGTCQYQCAIIRIVQTNYDEKSMVVVVDMISGRVVSLAAPRWT